ncbi:hypothetical protein KC336_g37 [Hortaea werneckii]|nr:hypothetical protein KC336_g37 [Hortaea werneckii]
MSLPVSWRAVRIFFATMRKRSLFASDERTCPTSLASLLVQGVLRSARVISAGDNGRLCLARNQTTCFASPGFGLLAGFESATLRAFDKRRPTLSTLGVSSATIVVELLLGDDSLAHLHSISPFNLNFSDLYLSVPMCCFFAFLAYELLVARACPTVIVGWNKSFLCIGMIADIAGVKTWGVLHTMGLKRELRVQNERIQSCPKCGIDFECLQSCCFVYDLVDDASKILIFSIRSRAARARSRSHPWKSNRWKAESKNNTTGEVWSETLDSGHPRRTADWTSYQLRLAARMLVLSSRSLAAYCQRVEELPSQASVERGLAARVFLTVGVLPAETDRE